MMKRCGKIIKRGVMSESRPCIRKAGHLNYCTPDLTGLRFGKLLVIKLGRKEKYKSGSHVVWNVVSDSGKKHKFRSSALIEGHVNGFPRGSKKIHGLSGTPELNTVVFHWHCIYNPKNGRHSYYVNMPFYNEWNPTLGGTYSNGANWILKNLGPKPGTNWSMDIIEHSKGFVPGNLRWAKRKLQKDNQQHRSLGQISEEEFSVEAKRRGYIKLI